MKLFSIILCIILVFCTNCSSPQKKKGQPDYTHEISRQNAKSECLDSFIIGKDFYDRYRTLQGLDITNFYSAIAALEMAKDKCIGQEYEDDIIYTLANAYFYIGDFGKAMHNYRKISEYFSKSSYNTGKYTAREEYNFLRLCFADPMIDYYRKAEVYELHKDFKNSIQMYEYVKNSSCYELKKRSTRKVKMLKYMK